MLHIFLSYRRDDSAGDVGRLYDHLVDTKEFQDGGIFMDIDSIDPGTDFVQRIEAALSVSDVLIVVIGKNWISIKDKHGNRRLENPKDAVRKEIEFGIDLGIPIIPVLVQGMVMPSTEELPKVLQPLSGKNAVEISNSRFDYDFVNLMTAIRKLAGTLQKSDEEKGDNVDPDDLYAVGMHYIRQKNYANGRTCLQAVISKKPEHAEAYVGLATSSQLEAYSMIVKRNYGFAEELLQEAEEFIKTGLQYEDANPHFFVQMGYIRKDIAQAYVRLNRQEKVTKAIEKARTHFQMALGTDENNPSALNGLASLAIMAGEFDEAIKMAQKAIEVAPGYAAASHDLAVAYYGKTRQIPEEAERAKYLFRFLETYKDILENQEDPDAEKLPIEAMESLRKISEYVIKEANHFTSSKSKQEVDTGSSDQ